MGNSKEKVDKKQKKKSKKANDSEFSEKDVMTKKEDRRNKVNNPDKKKKRKREKGNDINSGDTIQISGEDGWTKAGEKKRNKLRKKKKRSEEQDNALVGKYDQLGAESEDGFNEQKDVMTKKEDKGNKVNNPAKKNKRKREKGNDIDDGDTIRIDDQTKSGEKKRSKMRKKKKRSQEQDNDLVGKYDQLGANSKDGFHEQKGKSKKSKKKKKEHDTSKEDENILEKRGETSQAEAYCISSGDEDCSKGMKKWVTEYHQSRPGLKVLQQRLDEFIVAHEEKIEQERKEREAQAAEGGWTVVKHHKGRKKTTDSESGITMGSAAPAAVESQMTKKKPKEVGIEFYRFQKREAQRSEIMALRTKFEEDRKRIQQLRAARKFRPY